MGVRWSSRILAILVGTVLLAAGLLTGSAAQGPAEAPADRVSLEVVGLPLPTVLEQLSTPDQKLDCRDDLRELKAVVLVHEAPRREVLDRLALVFGCEWEKDPDDPKRLVLRRTSEVERWLRQWRAARQRAEARARQFQAEQQLALMRQALARLDGPLERDANGREVAPEGINSVPLARLLRSLGPDALRRIALESAEAAAVRAGGQGRYSQSPLTLPVSQLNAEQRAQLWEGLGLAPGMDDGQEAITLYKAPDAGVTLTFFSPTTGRLIQQSALSTSPSPMLLEGVLQRQLWAELGGMRTPSGAMLGAAIERDGSVRGAVRVEDGTRLEGRENPPAAPLLRPEWLRDTARRFGLNVVADHHTRSPRVRALAAGPELHATVTEASEAYRTVFRLGSGWLLARAGFWPDLDEEETPYPLPERWLSRKGRTGGLPFHDHLRMIRLTEAQLAGLGAYDDGSVHLRPELSQLHLNWGIMHLLAHLPPEQLRAAEEKGGIRVADLPLPAQTALQQMVPVAVPWNQVRLFVRIPPRDASGVSWAIVFLAVPGSQPVSAFSLPVSAFSLPVSAFSLPTAPELPDEREEKSPRP